MISNIVSVPHPAEATQERSFQFKVNRGNKTIDPSLI